MPVINPTTLRTNIYRYLHATSESDAIIATDGELDRVLSDELSDLAMHYGLFVERDSTFITLIAGQAMYALPPRHLSTLHVALASRPLVASSREELEKRDTGYASTAATTAAPVRRFYEDKSGFNMIGFHPVPSVASGAGSQVEVVFHRFPCEISDNVTAPAFIGDLLEVLTTREVYMKESDLAMPEVAKSLEGLAGIYEAVIKELWQTAQ